MGTWDVVQPGCTRFGMKFIIISQGVQCFAGLAGVEPGEVDEISAQEEFENKLGELIDGLGEKK